MARHSLQYAAVNNAVTPPKKRGCLFYGCLALLLCGLILTVLAYAGYRYASRTINRWVNEYTDTAPLKIENVEISSAELSALQKRIAAFGEALESQRSELLLSADEINALIAKDPTLKDLRGKLFVIIEADRIKGKISLPLENIGPLKLKGRYLNGVATFKVFLERRNLSVRVDRVEVKGKPLPPVVLSELQKQNFGQEIQNNPEAGRTLKKFDSIQIKDGQLILKSKGKE